MLHSDDNVKTTKAHIEFVQNLVNDILNIAFGEANCVRM